MRVGLLRPLVAGCPARFLLRAPGPRLSVDEERGRPRPLPLARDRAPRRGAERLERRDPVEQAVSPAPPAPSASRRRADRSRRLYVPRARSGDRRGVRGPPPAETGSAASRCPGSPASRCRRRSRVYVASTSRSSTSRAVVCNRSPRRYFCRHRDFSTVGTSHSTTRYIDSSAGPLRRASRSVPPVSATTGSLKWRRPPDAPRT